MFKRLIALGVSVSLLHGGTSLAEEMTSDSGDDEGAVRFVIEGIRESRGKLKSGVCQFTGAFISRWSEEKEKDLEGPISGLVAVDGGKLRFDISRPGWVVDPNTIEVTDTGEGRPKHATAETVKGILHKKFADNNVRVAFWNGLSPLVVISQSKDFTNRRTTEYVDIWGLTLYDRKSRSSAQTFPEVLEGILRLDGFVKSPREDAKVTREVARRENGVWSLIWNFENAYRLGKFSLTVDINSGFIPTEYKGESAPPDDPTRWQVDWVNRTRWANLDHVWVPVHHEWEWAKGEERPRERMTCDFAWTDVNQSVDSALFDYTTFALPDDVAIQDISNGQLVWIKAFAPQPEMPGPSSSWSASLRLAAIALTVLVLVYLCWFGSQYSTSGSGKTT